MFRWIRPII